MSCASSSSTKAWRTSSARDGTASPTSCGRKGDTSVVSVLRSSSLLFSLQRSSCVALRPLRSGDTYRGDACTNTDSRSHQGAGRGWNLPQQGGDLQAGSLNGMSIVRAMDVGFRSAMRSCRHITAAFGGITNASASSSMSSSPKWAGPRRVCRPVPFLLEPFIIVKLVRFPNN